MTHCKILNDVPHRRKLNPKNEIGRDILDVVDVIFLLQESF